MKRISWLILPVLWTLALSVPLGPLPRGLGPLLDFYGGVWRHQKNQWSDKKIKGLKQPVHVAIDHAGVPHIFAQNEADLYLAQGYVVASQRLFQMDLSTRVMDGRLSELVGPRAQETDRFFLRYGMRETLDESVEDYKNQPRTGPIFESFIRGVNAYIETAQDWPVEYKFFGARPEPFTLRRSVAYGRAITFSLSGRSYDLYLTQVQLRLGTAKALDLFPDLLPAPYEDVVFQDLDGTAGGNATSGERPSPRAAGVSFVTHLKGFPASLQPLASNGSNNFAVGPARSVTGKSLFANDTHLGLSLPNVWFELQLWTPGQNVYGVAMPALPGILAGFTPSIAWGPTNGGTDATDWYEIEFENETSLNYRWNGSLIAAEVSRQPIAGTHENVEVIRTKYGFVMHREGKYGLAARWLGHQMGNTLGAVLDLYKSGSAADCVRALRQWESPTQNFICADPKNIALVLAGRLPRRKPGEGRFVQNAAHFTAPLETRIPEADRPLEVNPARGFVGSSNQRVTGPDYPYNLGWDFEEPFRARRVRRLLSTQDKYSAADLRRIMHDDFDPQAEAALPLLLKQIELEKLDDEQRAWLAKLRGWDYVVRADDALATIYKPWWLQLKKELFDDDYPQPERKFYPKDMRVLWLLQSLSDDPTGPDAKWVDDLSTPEKETLPQIVTRAFQKSWAGLKQSMGPDSAAWAWWRWTRTEWSHAGRIPGFGSGVLREGGAGESVRANKGKHGAVYRSVVELGDWPKAWIQVPGGASGDPFSPDFTRGLAEWVTGEMREVEFYHDLEEARHRAVQVVELQPGGL